MSGKEAIVEETPPSSPGAVVASRVRYEVLGMSFLMAFLMYMERGAIGTAAPSIMREFHMDRIAMGLAISAFSWSYALCQIPGGWMADRFGPRTVLAIAMAWLQAGLAQLAAICGGNLGGAISAVAVGYLATHFGWTSPFLLACGLCLLSAWLVSSIDPRHSAVEESLGSIA